MRRTMLLLLGISWMLLAAGQVAAQAPPESGQAVARGVRVQDANKAWEKLKRATVFEDVKVGEGGELSENVAALRILSASPGAQEALRRLAREAGTVGKLYAAIGLYEHDKAGFAQVMATLRQQKDAPVQILMGCRGGQITVGELLESEDPKAMRLKPGQAALEWFKLHDYGPIDIAGGGYTSMFLYDGQR